MGEKYKLNSKKAYQGLQQILFRLFRDFQRFYFDLNFSFGVIFKGRPHFEGGSGLRIRKKHFLEWKQTIQIPGKSSDLQTNSSSWMNFRISFHSNSSLSLFPSIILHQHSLQGSLSTSYNTISCTSFKLLFFISLLSF